MGWKRVKPSKLAAGWQRLLAGSGFGLKVFLLFMGVIGTAITAVAATGFIVPPVPLIGCALLLVAGSAVAAFVKGRTRLLPEAFVDELGSEGRYTATFCTTALLAEACDLTKPFYQHEYVPDDIAEQWRLRNPKAFVAIVSSEELLCACFGVLALTDSFWDGFIQGRLSDTQLRAGDILSLSEGRKAKRLYLSGVVVKEPSNYMGAKRARIMLWAMLIYLRRLYGLKQARELYALAVTNESRRLLEHLGFKVASACSKRTDKCDLYHYSLDASSWDALLTRVGDLSRMCDLRFLKEKL